MSSSILRHLCRNIHAVLRCVPSHTIKGTTPACHDIPTTITHLKDWNELNKDLRRSLLELEMFTRLKRGLSLELTELRVFVQLKLQTQHPDLWSTGARSVDHHLPVAVCGGSSGCSMSPRALDGACWRQDKALCRTQGYRTCLGKCPAYCWPLTRETLFLTSAPATQIWCNEKKTNKIIDNLASTILCWMALRSYVLVSSILAVEKESPKATAVEMIQDGE